MKLSAQKIFHSKGLQQSAVMIVGNNLATGLAAISLIIISRILGPNNFGDFSVGVAIFLILTRLIDLGISTSILKFVPQKQSKPKISSLISYTTKLKMSIGTIVLLVSLGLATLFLKNLNLGDPSIVYLAILLTAVIVAYDHLLSILQSLHLFTRAVAINAIQATTKFLGALLFLFFSIKNTTAIFILYAASPIISLLFTKNVVPSWVKLNFDKSFTAEKKQTIPFIKHASIAVVSIAIIENISILFTRHYLTAYETGLLGGVMRISAVILLTANSLGTVLYPRVAKYTHKADLKNYIKKASILTFLILLSFAFFVPISIYLIQYTVGPEYMAGNVILLILAAASFIAMATVPYAALFFSYDKPGYFSLIGIVQIVLVVGGNLLFVPLYGLEAAAFTSFMTRLVVFLLTLILGLWFFRKKR